MRYLSEERATRIACDVVYQLPTLFVLPNEFQCFTDFKFLSSNPYSEIIESNI